MENFIDNLFFSFFFFAPAGVANLVPPLVAKVPFIKRFNQPLDFGKSYKGIRIFGAHKTFRGLIAGMVFATLAVIIQIAMYENSEYIREISLIDYSSINPFLLGVLFGAGALIGDAVESFCKRRIGVEPGKAWFPFDQIDYIIGAILFTLLYIQLPWYLYVYILVLYFGLHLLFSYVGYLLKFKDGPI
jgi:CDP-2,3-bis-(O-geranylgeranyl)-sn-glycerol synthase